MFLAYYFFILLINKHEINLMSFIRAPGLGRGSISALIRHATAHSLTLAQCFAETKIKHNFDNLVEDPTPEQEIILINNSISI